MDHHGHLFTRVLSPSAYAGPLLHPFKPTSSPHTRVGAISTTEAVSVLWQEEQSRLSVHLCLCSLAHLIGMSSFLKEKNTPLSLLHP